MSPRAEELSEPACGAGKSPEADDEHGSDAIELVIRARTRDLGGFSVRRLLPFVRRRHVGPFVFLDHFGPTDVTPGAGINVRPHPHIGLSTVTYLFEGELVHRDSLGSRQTIRPGDVNWMTAGRGIVHSERTPPELAARHHRMHGVQAWVALPTNEEEAEPTFHHHPAASLPIVERGDATIRILAGRAFDETSPVHVPSPTLYAEVALSAGATLEVPPEHAERAVYVVTGAVLCAGESFGDGTMLVLRPGGACPVRAESDARILLLGGAPLNGPRTIYWNFVSSSAERIDRAQADWRAGLFPTVPGDDVEFIPLPDETA